MPTFKQTRSQVEADAIDFDLANLERRCERNAEKAWGAEKKDWLAAANECRRARTVVRPMMHPEQRELTKY